MEKKKESTKLNFHVGSVTVKYGMTLNIGNFESFRADAEATIVCDKVCKSEEEREAIKVEMFDYGWEQVKEQLKRQVKAVREATKKEV